MIEQGRLRCDKRGEGIIIITDNFARLCSYSIGDNWANSDHVIDEAPRVSMSQRVICKATNPIFPYGEERKMLSQ